MTKSGLIVPLCFVLTAGCALFDSAEMTTDRQTVPAPAIESTAASMPASDETSSVETSVAPRRNFTRDDIRTMQLRLREVGFDPGPIDGIAGGKTKSAFVRFQAGCSSVNAMIERWDDLGSQISSTSPAMAKIPNRQETQAIQTQLRNAGFNPGPIDGIFGNKTRSLLAQLKIGCPMSTDFAAMLDHANVVTYNAMRAPQGSVNNPTKPQASSTQVRVDSAKQQLALQPARSQEEVRILQLQLRDAGFDPGPFDGVMGPRTKSALQQYQASRKGDKATTAMISGFSGQY